MNAQDEQAVADYLVRLREQYISRLPETLNLLERLAADLGSEGPDNDRLEELHHRLHKLSGSGGSFGQVELSKKARKLEQQVQRWLEDKRIKREMEGFDNFIADTSALQALVEHQGSLSAVSSVACPITPDDSVQVWLVQEGVDHGAQLLDQLESFGFVVRLFTQLPDAEQALMPDFPDVVIIDELLLGDRETEKDQSRLRARLNRFCCPILLTALSDDFQSRAQAVRVGALGYFLKPLDVPSLVDRITNFLVQRAAAPKRILIVDDDRDLAQHYQHVLISMGMEVEILSNPNKIIETVSEFGPELVLMDLYMPEYSGLELAGIIRQHEKWISLPIVYLSAETDLDLQMRAVRRGGDEFLTKPISDAQLVASVSVRVDRARQLVKLIRNDSLTGLLKHTAIEEEAAAQLEHAKRLDQDLTVTMLDIDHFKSVNDCYGHAIGDLVISSIAMLLRQRLGRSATIGRYGGEEFVIVFPGHDGEHVRSVIDDVRQRFSSVVFNQPNAGFSCTLSAGIASSRELPDCDHAELIVAADQALYEAKRCGRNQVRQAHPTPDDSAFNAPLDNVQRVVADAVLPAPFVSHTVPGT